MTHWSSRLLVDMFNFSTDPELEAKVIDVVGLYLAPPENAIALCVDEKGRIQALNRTQKVLPLQPGHNEPSDPDGQRTHDDVRHGTTTLFAALEIATGTVTGLCKQRHRHRRNGFDIDPARSISWIHGFRSFRLLAAPIAAE